jgi:hypothetical protein
MRRVGPGGPSPRDTLSRDPLSALDGATRSIGCGFVDPQKIRSRGEGPLAPPGAASQGFSSLDTSR